MNIRQIEGFCILARTLNFSKSAERMYITQPAFSRMIESLEDELGYKLIIRDRVSPRLTQEGMKALKHMDGIRAEYEALQKLSADDNAEKTLTIGIMEAGLTDDIRDMFRRFASGIPELKLQFRESDEAGMFDLIRTGKIDCAVTAHFPEIYHEDLEGSTIGDFNICCVAAKDDPIADSDNVRVRDLKDERFVIIDEDKSVMGYQSIMSLCLKNGFSPKIARKEDSVMTALTDVDMGYGIMILPDAMKDYAGSNTVFIPLEGIEAGHIWLVKKKENDDEVLAELDQYIEKTS